MRWFAFAWMLLALVGTALPGSGLAQTAPAPSVAAPALSAQQAQQALDVLRDPTRRAELMTVLEALARLETLARIAPGRPAAAPVEEISAAAPVEETSAAAPEPAAVPAAAPAPSPAARPLPPSAGAPSAPVDATPAPTAPATAAAAAPGAAPAAAAAVPVLPDSQAAQVLMDLSDRLASLSDDIVEAVRTVTRFPLIVLWLVQFATDPALQRQLFDTLWRLALVLGTGLAAEYLVIRLVRPLHRRLAANAPIPPAAISAEAPMARAGTAALETEARQSARIWRRTRRVGLWLRLVPFGLAALAIDLLPMLAVLTTGYALIGGGLGAQPTPRLVILAALNAYVVYRLVNGVVAMLVAPREKRLRLLPIDDAMAIYVTRWARRAAAVGIFGYATVEAGLLFGLYRLAHGALIKIIILVLNGFVVAIILQQRQRAAALIRPREGATGVVARLRGGFAPIWHIAAVAYFAALWGVLALEISDGPSRLLRVSLATAGVLALAQFVLVLALGALYRLLHRGAAAVPPNAKPPNTTQVGLAGRLIAYEPMLRVVLRVVLGIATMLGLLEVWGVPVLVWLVQAELGGRLLRAIGSIGFTIVLALGVWEGVNLAIERHLAHLAANAQPARSARLRTLLPMFRTALLMTISVIAALIVLSEIGLNIAPLLAGAGVLGLAIGFGSQRLVQDVITGLFLLMENVMQVGDVVTLGGMSGTVENLSIRTIRLRALDGSMHIVPFSAVSTVTNMTRDFGYAVDDVSIGLNDDPQQIGDILRDVGAAMRREEKWATGISADLEVMGIDRFIDNALVLRTRIRTTPGQRWAVVRELNRRIKQRFDELDVRSPISAPRSPTPQAVEEASG